MGAFSLSLECLNNLSEREPLPEIPRSLALQFRKPRRSSCWMVFSRTTLSLWIVDNQKNRDFFDGIDSEHGGLYNFANLRDIAFRRKSLLDRKPSTTRLVGRTVEAAELQSMLQKIFDANQWIAFKSSRTPTRQRVLTGPEQKQQSFCPSVAQVAQLRA
jgi:hypothetical protein